MIKLIIFDLDDTLFSEKEYVFSGFKTVARFLSKKNKIKFSIIYKALVESFKRLGRGKNFDYIIEKFNFEKIKPSLLIKIYRNHLPAIRLYSEAEKSLKTLSKKYKLALLTNGWVEVQKRKVCALKLKNYFDSICYAQKGGLEFRKPHKKYFLKILKKYDLRPAEALMVGDDLEGDIKGAQKLGIKTYHVKKTNDLRKIIRYVNFSTR